MIQTKLALISFIQQLRDEENNLYQYLAYVHNKLVAVVDLDFGEKL